MRKKSFKEIRDATSTPKPIKQENADKKERITLYDSKSEDIRLKMIDRIIRAYKAKKLILKAQQIQKEGIEEENKEDLISRIVKGYNRNKDKIDRKQKQPELLQSDKRKRKLADLQSRSSSWKGLESFGNNIYEND
jgi:hypothetical protein